MAFADQFALANTQAFRARVMIALTTACTNVMAEDPTTPNHANRIIYASKALHNPQVETLNMVLGVCSNVAITPAATDADIQYTVNSLFNAYS